MWRFSERYQNKLQEADSTAFRNNIRNEVLMTEIIDNFIHPGTLILGDDGCSKLPDLYTEDRVNGFEIVQCDLDCDLDMKIIFRAIEKADGDYKKVREILKGSSTKDFDVDDYKFTVMPDGRIGAFSHKEFFRGYRYLDDTRKKTFEKKLCKLNNGNYSGCEKVSLIISSIGRQRGRLDAELTFNIYQEVLKNFVKTFDNIFLVTTSGVYEISKEVRLVKSYNNEFNSCIKSMKKVLRLDEYS